MHDGSHGYEPIGNEHLSPLLSAGEERNELPFQLQGSNRSLFASAVFFASQEMALLFR